MSENTKVVQMTPNAVLQNKYCVGDTVWACYSNGPNVRIGQFKIRAFVAEKITVFDDYRLLYGFQFDGDGKESEVANMTWIKEDRLAFDKDKIIKIAESVVPELIQKIDEDIEKMKHDFNRAMADNQNKYNKQLEELQKMRNDCNAKHLEPEEKANEEETEDEAVKNAEEVMKSEALNGKSIYNDNPNPNENTENTESEELHGGTGEDDQHEGDAEDSIRDTE